MLRRCKDEESTAGDIYDICSIGKIALTIDLYQKYAEERGILFKPDMKDQNIFTAECANNLTNILKILYYRSSDIKRQQFRGTDNPIDTYSFTFS
jgi:hypothetical protein